ncbi:MAG: sigma-70 family RNA polymerase sigma factor [Phycisphaerales bacterium]|nr:sigma-70 family RNA polymerase sigma factor [Phycisphaerales bacterium]
MNATTQTTQVLLQLGKGDPSAAGKLLPLVYDELRAMAEHYFRGQPTDHTLQPTALVHEAFLKLVDQTAVNWQGRAHFLAVSATAMRQILVDHARARAAAKRGGDRLQLTLDEALTPMGDSPDFDLLALNEALSQLAELDERQGRIVEMRFFGGMKVKEIAEVLGVAKTTVDNLWRAAQAWLNVRLRGESS